MKTKEEIEEEIELFKQFKNNGMSIMLKVSDLEIKTSIDVLEWVLNKKEE